MIEYPPHPRCGLPVVRLHIDDERDEWVRSVEVCGEELYFKYENSEPIYDDGPDGPNDGPVWEVACLSGHVLFTPDDQGNEQYGEMAFHWDEALAAIAPLLQKPEAS